MRTVFYFPQVAEKIDDVDVGGNIDAMKEAVEECNAALDNEGAKDGAKESAKEKVVSNVLKEKKKYNVITGVCIFFIFGICIKLIF